MNVEIFIGPNCSYCVAAKALLDARGIGYLVRDMRDATVRQEFADRLPRVRSIPQVFIDDEHIGGF